MTELMSTPLARARADFEFIDDRRRHVWLSIMLVLFLVSCVFDPADRLLGLKVYLFVTCWAVALFPAVASAKSYSLHAGLLIYILLFLAVPVFSIALYWSVDGRPEFEGFQLLKGYVLISLAALLYMCRIDLLPALSAILAVLAGIIIGVFVVLLINPVLTAPLYLFGNATGILYLSDRDYGSGLVLSQIYFATSPMLAISIPYYFHLMKNAVTHGRRALYFVLVTMGIVAMFLAGTRNNMAVALLLPLVLHVFYAKNRALSILVIALLLIAVSMLFFDEIAVLLDPSEFSNNVKLGLLDDYRRIFEKPRSLLFGDGLGAYDYWQARGSVQYISELTYLEVVRNFGVFGGVVMLGLLVFPLVYACFGGRAFHGRHIVLGYAFYLVMCASNPNLFSSMGILILAILVSNVFMNETVRNENRANVSQN